MRARPMHAIPDRDAGCIWFITDTRGAKDDEIAALRAELSKLQDKVEKLGK